MVPGDTFLTNDPFEGGTHACDFAIIRPVFADDRVVAFAIAVAHLLDVGGAVAGSLPPDAVSVFQEGLRLSGIRLTRNDRLIEDVVRIVAENVRLPQLTLGDINAELAAVRIADRRVGGDGREVWRADGRVHLRPPHRDQRGSGAHRDRGAAGWCIMTPTT